MTEAVAELEAPRAGGLVIGTDGDDVIAGSPARDTILGNDGNDRIQTGDGTDHIDGGFGGDHLEGGDHPDLILGGPGHDTLFGEDRRGGSPHPGGDIIHGGPGDDGIHGGRGDDQLLGGPDRDEIFGNEGDDIIVGGAGDDDAHGEEGNDHISGGAGRDTLRGGPGNDHLHGGIGPDLVYGGEGDDTIVINGECELGPGEYLDGGPGNDRVLSPFTEQELIERGVRFESIESFVSRWRDPVVPGKPLGSDEICRYQDPRRAALEVSGLVTSQEAMWQDEAGTLHAQDGTFHGRWSIVTRYRLLTDTVYFGKAERGEPLSIILPGGAIDASDGGGMVDEGCCFTPLRVGERYRLELRELRASDGTGQGWEYDWLVESTLDHSLVLPLGPDELAASLGQHAER